MLSSTAITESARIQTTAKDNTGQTEQIQQKKQQKNKDKWIS
jgi:hypothetical protein